MTDDNEPFDEDTERVLTRKELTQSRSRLRNWVNRDHEASEKRSKQLASQLLYGNSMMDQTHNAKRREYNSIIYGSTNLANKVLNSLNLTPKISMYIDDRSHPSVRGMTDFEKISMTINPTSFDVNDIESMAELLNMVKGLIYHEGGHLLYTTPLPKLCGLVGCGGSHVFPSDAVMPEGLTDADYVMFHSYSHHAWNVLEDQRMETALIAMSPVMARYLTTLVCRNVVNTQQPEVTWPWIAGRTYLPRPFRQYLRDAAEAHPFRHLIPAMNEIIMRYRRSNDPVEMHKCIIDMTVYLVAWVKGFGLQNGVDNHNDRNVRVNNREYKFVVVPTPDDYEVEEPSESNSGSNSESSDESDNTEDGDGEGEPQSPSNGDTRMGIEQFNENVSNGGEPDNADKPEDGDRSAGHESGPKSAKDIVNDIVKDGVDQTNTDEVTSFISDINDSRNAIAARDESATPMSADQSRRVIDIRNGMMDVLDRLIVQVDPTWTFYQDNGVLDPTAYMTRDPGDTNFWSGMDGDQGNGHDLAVSLLVDSSGSMDNEITQVSIIAMGIRRACETYDIPCTITTFSDVVRLVAAGDQQTEDLKVDAGGGTHIFEAMTLLDSQRYGKRYHLVVILTDGEWGDLKDVRAWAHPTRHIMIVGLNIDKAMILNKGANSCVTISDISQLASLVTNSVAGYFN